jgi:hypothetical protein
MKELRAKLRKAESDAVTWANAAAIERAAKDVVIDRLVEVTRGVSQMRNALEFMVNMNPRCCLRQGFPVSTHHVECKVGRALAATDAGRDYQSPEQVAHACAAARVDALEDAARLATAVAKVSREEAGAQCDEAEHRDWANWANGAEDVAERIRALKETP